MAAYNVELRKNDGSAFADLFYLKTTWTMIESKPSTFTPTAHNHTKSEITDFPASMPASDVYAWAKAATKPSYTYSEVGAAASSHTHAYAPTSHASIVSTYGLGTTANYGHVKTINALTQSSHSDGTALSAYQGYVLQQGKAPTDHTQAVTKGGTGLTSIAIGEMMYASGANEIGKITTSSFGRSLLNTTTGVVVSGLNAQQLAGYVHSDFRKTTEAVFRSIKNWSTYLAVNGTTAVNLPTAESISGRLIGIAISTSTSATRPRAILWVKMDTTSGTTYVSAFQLISLGNDVYTGGIILYQGEFYHVSGSLYIDDVYKTSISTGSPASGTCVSSTDIKIWDIYVLD